MVLNLKEVSVNEGMSLPFNYSLDLSDIVIYSEHPYTSPIEVNGVVYNRASVLELSAVAVTQAKFRCARCAKEFSKKVEFSIFHVLVDSVSEDSSDESIEISDGLIDLDRVVRDEIIVNTDMTHLCNANCKGLCPFCGTDLNESVCGCSSGEIDPRLASLKELLDHPNQ